MFLLILCKKDIQLTYVPTKYIKSFVISLTVFRYLASTGRAQSFAFNNKSVYAYPNGTWKFDEITSATSQLFGEVCDDTSVCFKL